MSKAYNNKNIVSNEQGMKLIGNGYFALDPHCHSSYSYDVPDADNTSPEKIVKMQKVKGLSTVLTDHNTIEGYNYLRHKGTRIIPAVELTFKPLIARKIISNRPIQTLHINIFGLNNNDLTIIKEITERGDLDELVAYLKQNDLDWMYNHPFFHANKEHLNWRVIPALAKNYFDVIELNSSYPKGLNDVTQKLAEKLGKGIVAGSDSHTGNPGMAFVVAEGKNFKDFWENVKEGKNYVMRKDLGTMDIVHEASLIINQAFNARLRPRPGRKYTPATSVEPFDNLMRSVTSGRLKNRYIAKNVIRMILQSINYTAVPIFAWRFHVTKNEEIADRIRKKMGILTNNILADKIKQIKKSQQFNNAKNNLKLRYYGQDLVKHSKKHA
jgi:predicted metal-dependent phosphoesterase TrpH